MRCILDFCTSQMGSPTTIQLMFEKLDTSELLQKVLCQLLLSNNCVYMQSHNYIEFIEHTCNW